MSWGTSARRVGDDRDRRAAAGPERARHVPPQNTFCHSYTRRGGTAAPRGSAAPRVGTGRPLHEPEPPRQISHRLGHETSEDALTWNVFAGLADAGKLKQAVHFLTGRTVTGEPRLYLWGELIDPEHRRREHFEPLREVRGRLEPDIHTFQTEPDIMLVVDGELLVCVEANFTSGNPIAHETVTRTEEKPADRRGLLDRYYGKASEATQRAMDPSRENTPSSTRSRTSATT